MHRSSLLHVLTVYADRYPEERDMVARFRRFVEAEPRCFERSLAAPGHITGSAWIVDPDGDAVLLTHHRKLDIWIQLGGHADGDPDVFAVARREGLEESGLPDLELLDPFAGRAAGRGTAIPYDVDIHTIPGRPLEPEHLHFDVRFAFRSPRREFAVSAESHSLAWVPIANLDDYTSDESVRRMADKWNGHVVQ